MQLSYPFASFVYFCHEENFKLNEFMNNCANTSSFLSENRINHSFLSQKSINFRLNLILNNSKSIEVNKKSITFWNERINKIIIKLDR